MCWKCCFCLYDDENVTLERISGDKMIMLKGQNKLWHPNGQNSRSRVSVSGSDRNIEWIVWQNEDFYKLFGKVIQQEGEQTKIRFVTRGSGNRLIVGDVEDYSPSISTDTSDPRLFVVDGPHQSHVFYLKHCETDLNVMADNENFLVISDSPGSPWDMSPVYFVASQENQCFQQYMKQDSNSIVIQRRSIYRSYLRLKNFVFIGLLVFYYKLSFELFKVRMCSLLSLSTAV